MTEAPSGAPLVAIVLPPKERFAPAAAGAVALVVRDVATGTLPPWRVAVLGTAPEGPAFPGAEFHPLPASLLGRLMGMSRAYSGAALRVLRQLKPARVEVHNRAAISLRIARGLPGTPVTLVLHNDPQGMKGARTPAERQRLLAAHAGIVVVSDYLRQRFLEGLAEGVEQVRVIRNGLPLDALPAPAEQREKLILFVGRVCADKGADSFVQACAIALPRLPGWRAAIIGADRFGADSPETPFLAALRPQAAAAGVEMRGHQENDVALATMARAAILAVPSRWAEPLGRTAQEGLACGAALVTSGRGGLLEVCGEAALQADPDDPTALANSLLRLAGDDAFRAELARHGIAQAQGFAMPAVAARWAAQREGRPAT